MECEFQNLWDLRWRFDTTLYFPLKTEGNEKLVKSPLTLELSIHFSWKQSDDMKIEINAKSHLKSRWRKRAYLSLPFTHNHKLFTVNYRGYEKQFMILISIHHVSVQDCARKYSTKVWIYYIFLANSAK